CLETARRYRERALELLRDLVERCQASGTYERRPLEELSAPGTERELELVRTVLERDGVGVDELYAPEDAGRTQDHAGEVARRLTPVRSAELADQRERAARWRRFVSADPLEPEDRHRGRATRRFAAELEASRPDAQLYQLTTGKLDLLLELHEINARV